MAITLKTQGPLAARKVPEVAFLSVKGQKKKNLSFQFGGSLRSGEILFFTSQLSLMIEIGTPLKQALKTIEEQTQNPTFKNVLHIMVQDIEEGRQLSDALRRHPRIFNNVFVSMVKAGETGGFLKEILDRMVEIQENQQALKTQLRSALTYPAVLCIVASLVIVFVLTYVLPKFTVFFSGKESILPLTTRFLMGLSASMKAYWWVYILSLIGTIVGFRVFTKSPTGSALKDLMAVKIPLVSALSNKVHTCQLLRVLGNLLESQVPLVEGLQVTRATITNRYFRDFIDRIIEHVEAGGKFSKPFATYPYTMESVKKMVSTGEETGNLPKVMIRLAEFYDTEVERELKNLASMIEPLALIFMGGIVGVIVSSVILPLFKLAGTIR